jgi:hypothetical protein
LSTTPQFKRSGTQNLGYSGGRTLWEQRVWLYAPCLCVESKLRDAMFRDYICILLTDCTGEPIGHQLTRSNHEPFFGGPNCLPRPRLALLKNFFPIQIFTE